MLIDTYSLHSSVQTFCILPKKVIAIFKIIRKQYLENLTSLGQIVGWVSTPDHLQKESHACTIPADVGGNSAISFSWSQVASINCLDAYYHLF